MNTYELRTCNTKINRRGQRVRTMSGIIDYNYYIVYIINAGMYCHYNKFIKIT